MKRKELFAGTGAGLLLPVMMVICLLLPSCGSKSSADLTDLLNTVPADVTSVTVFDLSVLLEKSGCKINGNEVKSGPEVQKALAGLTNPNLKQLIEGIMSGESGVELSGTVIFIEGYNTYLTGTLVNPDKFKSFVESHADGEKFSDGDISICSNAAFKGNQYWVCISSRNTISKEEVSRFAGLDSKQSFMSSPDSPDFAKLDHDMKMWGNINALLSIGGKSMGNAALMRMGVNMLFEDPQYVLGYLDFKKGFGEMEVKVLNSNSKTAKFLLPTDKINVGDVKSTATTADMVFAIAINSKFVKKVEEIAKSLGGSLPVNIGETFKALDGTVAFSLGADDSLSGIVVTNGDNTAALSSMLSSLGTVKKENKNLLVSKGTVAGHLDVAKAADGFKGAMLAVKSDVDKCARLGAVDESAGAIRFVTLLLVPDDGGIDFRVEFEGKDAGADILPQVIANL